MYYKGTPLVERNRIIESESRNYSSFFKQKEEGPLFAEKIFESICNQRINLVVYFNSVWNNEELMRYHNENYGGIGYFSQELVGERTIKTVIVQDEKISGYTINHHDGDWKETIEHSYDAEYSLIEYREFLYEKGKDTIVGENIFYASSWLVSREKYD